MQLILEIFGGSSVSAGTWLRKREIMKMVLPCAPGHGLYICIECHINGGSLVRVGTWRLIESLRGLTDSLSVRV